LRKILNKIKKGTQIKICIGNHDAFLGILKEYNIGDIEVDYKFIHESNGYKYLVLHGDIFDKTLKNHGFVWLVSLFYSYFQKYEVFKKIRKRVDKIIEKEIDYKEILHCKEKYHVDGMIFGHTHVPNIDVENHIMNCGDMVHNFTILVEHDDFSFELIYL